MNYYDNNPKQMFLLMRERNLRLSLINFKLNLHFTKLTQILQSMKGKQVTNNIYDMLPRCSIFLKTTVLYLITTKI